MQALIFLNLQSLIKQDESDQTGVFELPTSDKAIKDEALKQQEKQAEDEGVCIPIGEGENCW